MDYSQLATEVMAKTGKMMKSSFWPKKAHAFLHGEMFILNFLAHHSGIALPSELSLAMNTSSARIAMALKSLETKGYIVRQIDHEDRRKVLVSITEDGRGLVKSERDDIHEKMVRILSELGEADTKEYLRIIGRITDICTHLFGNNEQSQ